MDNNEFINKADPELVTSMRIEIKGYEDIVKEPHDTILLFKYDEDWAIYLGEYDMWHWVAPLSTMAAMKEDDSIFDREEFEISVEDIMNQIS